MREDIPIGLQMAQAVHAAFEFYRDHRELTDEWLKLSNYVVIIGVPDENAVLDLIKRAAELGIPRTGVREPDLDQQVTAVALGPTAMAQRICANIHLAGRQLVPG